MYSLNFAIFLSPFALLTQMIVVEKCSITFDSKIILTSLIMKLVIKIPSREYELCQISKQSRITIDNRVHYDSIWC